jgi:hypothetical protein
VDGHAGRSYRGFNLAAGHHADCIHADIKQLAMSMPPPVVTTNLLALPLLLLTVETGNSEDWIESVKYLVDTADPVENKPQVDLRGIEFEMEVRRSSQSHEVVLAATSDDGSIAVGEPPDFGYLIINVGFGEMKLLQAGKYVADIRGKDDKYTRICIQIDLTVFDGITR